MGHPPLLLSVLLASCRGTKDQAVLTISGQDGTVEVSQLPCDMPTIPPVTNVHDTYVSGVFIQGEGVLVCVHKSQSCFILQKFTGQSSWFSWEWTSRPPRLWYPEFLSVEGGLWVVGGELTGHMSKTQTWVRQNREGTWFPGVMLPLQLAEQCTVNVRFGNSSFYLITGGVTRDGPSLGSYIHCRLQDFHQCQTKDYDSWVVYKQDSFTDLPQQYRLHTCTTFTSDRLGVVVAVSEEGKSTRILPVEKCLPLNMNCRWLKMPSLILATRGRKPTATIAVPTTFICLTAAVIPTTASTVIITTSTKTTSALVDSTTTTQPNLSGRPPQMLLVGGGYHSHNMDQLSSIEVISPHGSLSCSLPTMARARAHFSINAFSDRLLACGGDEGASTTCELFDGNAWTLRGHTRFRRRLQTSFSQSRHVFLVGGNSSDSRKTTEIFSDTGALLDQGFGLVHERSRHCSIEINHFVILTGGEYTTSPSRMIDTSDKVTKYSFSADVFKVPMKEDLQHLIKKRSRHACGWYETISGIKVS